MEFFLLLFHASLFSSIVEKVFLTEDNTHDGTKHSQKPVTSSLLQSNQSWVPGTIVINVFILVLIQNSGT